jgi:hypothetical protein
MSQTIDNAHHSADESLIRHPLSPAFSQLGTFGGSNLQSTESKVFFKAVTVQLTKPGVESARTYLLLNVILFRRSFSVPFPVLDCILGPLIGHQS